MVDELDSLDLDLLCHLLASAPTFGGALELLKRHVGVVHDGVVVGMRQDGDAIHFTHAIAGTTQRPVMVDFAVGLIVRFCREVLGQPPPLLVVHLARPRPPDRYRSWFGAPVHFDAKCNELVFPASSY